MAHQHRTPSMTAAATLAVLLTACTGTPPAQPATDAATAAPPTAPAPATAATPRLSEAPVAELELLWEGSGDTEIAGWFPGTYSPAVDPLTGDVWVALPSEHLLWIFSADGEFKGTFGEPGDGPGEFDFQRPACRDCPGAGALAFSPDGSLFVADVGNHRVQKFDPDHEFETEWGDFGAGDGQFADAIGIAVSEAEVAVVDDARLDVQVFDAKGELLRTLPGRGWVSFDAAGSLHVSEEGMVRKYDAAGQVLETLDLPDYRGAFHVGLAIDDARGLFWNFQDPDTAGAIGLGLLEPATGESEAWSTGGETLAIAGDVIYLANYTGPGWPRPVLRAYALPTP